MKAPPDDAKRTASGLAYKVLRPGNGTRSPSPVLTGDRALHRLDDRRQDVRQLGPARHAERRCDSTSVIKGWTEGVPMMVEGERTRFWIPENLAYKGKGDGPRGMLVFDIELVEIQ